MHRDSHCFDHARWHYEGQFPEELAPECGATHIGMFFTWVVDHQLENPEIAVLADTPSTRFAGVR